VNEEDKSHLLGGSIKIRHQRFINLMQGTKLKLKTLIRAIFLAKF